MNAQIQGRSAQCVLAVLVAVLCWLYPRGVAAQDRIYVDGDASGANTGVSWADAYTDLQSALNQAGVGEGTEVWVAQGVYTPGITYTATFSIPAGVAIYGGFAATETERTQRDWVANVTVLSGDIDHNDVTDASGVVTTTAGITGTNSSHVVLIDKAVAPITATTKLDGLTITAGKTGPQPSYFLADCGGGLYCQAETGIGHCSPTIANVSFRGNFAGSGGAICSGLGQSEFTLTNVLFSHNAASHSGGAIYGPGSRLTGTRSVLTDVRFENNSAQTGGAIAYDCGFAGGHSAKFTDVIFEGNQAELGGAIASGTATACGFGLTFADVAFDGNRATNSGGGAMYNGGGVRATFTNVTFRNNSAAGSGGALAQAGSPTAYGPNPSIMDMTNATFSGNAAGGHGGAIYSSSWSTVTMTNTVIWGNYAGSPPVLNQIALSDTGTVNGAYNLVQGGWPGEGNSDGDPRFVDAAGGDLRLLPGSAAIDAGTNTGAPLGDIRGLPRPVNAATDMGAYEAQGFSLAITGSDRQTTTVAAAFAAPLAVQVASSRGEPVGPGGVVKFTPPATGAGLSVTQPLTAVTDVTGSAAVRVSANSLLGSYHVAVSASGVLTPLAFTLTNLFGSPLLYLPAVLCWSHLCGVAAQDRIYVDGDASGANTGASWADAYTDLQSALKQAGVGEGTEVWVAQGVYTPGISYTATFSIPAGVAIYGGFAATETERTQRDWVANVTVLSGDIDHNDVTDAIGVVTTTAGITGTNSSHVVWLDGYSTPITATTRLDGVTVTGGSTLPIHDYREEEACGGGLYCSGSSGSTCSPTIVNASFYGNYGFSGGAICSGSEWTEPTLSNVLFSGNAASMSGGAIKMGSAQYTLRVEHCSSMSPTMNNVTFENNIARYGAAVAYYCDAGPMNPRFTNVIFSRNHALNIGGAISCHSYDDSTELIFSNVFFFGNRAEDAGGGLSCGCARITLTNAVFSNNSTGNYAGGALQLIGSAESSKGHNVAEANLTNVSFSGNTAGTQGGAIYSGMRSTVRLTNTVMWGNYAGSPAVLDQIGFDDDGEVLASYSLVQGGWPGEGNSDGDPRFVDAAGGDLRLLPGSAAIDAGTNSGAPLGDIRGLPRPVNAVTDMGAYEAQELANICLPVIRK